MKKNKKDRDEVGWERIKKYIRVDSSVKNKNTISRHS